MYDFFNIALIIICLVFNFINSLYFGKRLNISKAQNYVWMFAFIIYLSDIFEYYDIKVEVYIYSLTYIAVFNLTYLIFGKKNNYSTKILHDGLVDSLGSFKNNLKVLEIVSVICWIITVPLLIKSIPILVSSGMNVLRYTVYSDNSIYSTLDMMLIQYIVRPIFSITIIITAIMLTIRKYNYNFFIITIINAIVFSLLTSGRALFMQILVYTALSLWFFHGSNILRLLRLYRKIIIPSLFILVAIFWVSSLRVNRDYGVMGDFVIYMTSSLPYLSALLETNKVEFYSLFGSSFFSFLIDPLLLVLKFFDYEVFLASQAVSELTMDSLYVSPTIVINAIASTLLEFLLEAGYLGIIIGGVIASIIAVTVENNFYKKRDIFSYVIFLFILQIMFFSIQFYGLGKPSVFFSLFFILVFVSKPFKKIRKLRIKNKLY